MGGATGVLQAMSPAPNSGPLPFAFSEPPAPAPPAMPATPPAAPPPPQSGGSPMMPPLLPPPVFAPAASASPGSPPSASAPSAAGPSEYTQLIQKAAPPPPPAPAAKPAANERQGKTSEKRLPLGLIIALNVIAILAIALVLYFVLRPAPTEVSSPTPSSDAPAVTAPEGPSA